MKSLSVWLSLLAFGCHDGTPRQQARAELGAAEPRPVRMSTSPDQEEGADATFFQGAGAASGSSRPRCAGPVLVRVRNTSSVDFDAASIDELQFGSVRAGAVSDYKPVESGRCIYRYGSMSITSGKQRFMVFPIDFVGETPLPPGFYTQALTPVPSEDAQMPGGLEHRISKDPPPTR